MEQVSRFKVSSPEIIHRIKGRYINRHTTGDLIDEINRVIGNQNISPADKFRMSYWVFGDIARAAPFCLPRADLLLPLRHIMKLCPRQVVLTLLNRAIDRANADPLVVMKLRAGGAEDG